MSSFARHGHRISDELGRGLSIEELAIAHRRWIREPDQDRRIARGDDFAGDAWRDSETGEIRYVAVGQKP